MKYLYILLCLFITQQSYSQEVQKGKVIEEFGKTYSIESPDYKTDTTTHYKVVFDIGRSFNNPSETNKLIESAARFLNMHEMAGVPTKNMEIALVFHGAATLDIVKNKMYVDKNKFPEITTNPNTPLLTALANKGVNLILCGQSAEHLKIKKEDLHKNVKIALSAMTALVQLQNDGYRLIHF